MIQRVLDRLCVAFAGAVLGLLLAEYGFGAKGLHEPKSVVSAGLYLSLAALATVRIRAMQARSHNSEAAGAGSTRSPLSTRSRS